MTQLHIERTGGIAGARDVVHVDDLSLDAPRVHVEAFMSEPQDHVLAPDLRDQLREAVEALRAEHAGAGDPPRGADRYQWDIRIGSDGDGDVELVFHDPITNAAARSIASVAAQLLAAS